ncbi:MAG: hypothetical protein ACNS63_00815 [Candidatus Nitrospinota bacterium M3_3B_026]
MAIDVSELVEKYGLPEEIVREEIERAITMSLTSKLKLDVEGFFDENGVFVAKTYRESLVGVKAERLRHVSRSAFAAVKKCIEHSLHERSTIKDHGKFSYLVNTLIHGTVFNINAAGDLYVMIEAGLVEGVVGTCLLRHQPPHERGTYSRGERLPFHVLKVTAKDKDEDEPPRLNIQLSRESRRFVELLLQQETSGYARIECVRRLPGVVSDIRSDRSLPRDAIKRVSYHLGERIKVRWSSGF